MPRHRPAIARRETGGMKRTWGTIALIVAWSVLAALGLPAAAHAADAKPLKGVALVIGNGDYEHIGKLANPVNDARAIEAMLDGLGFETTLVSDRNARRLRRDLDGFVEDAEGADVAVVYYSGHGIEAGGENYLVPVDADLSALDEAGERLVPISEVLGALRKSVSVTILMLDACRSDPFPPGTLVRTSDGAQGNPIGTSGLGAVRGAVPLASSSNAADSLGTVIGFAAEPGRVALDGNAGSNSPYAAAILRHLGAIDGMEFGTVMRMVAEEVYLKTGGRQRPWTNESLRRLLYFGSAPPAPTGAEGDILTERRSLLLTIAALPANDRRQIETIASTDGVPMDGLYAMLAALGADAPKDPAELDRLMRSQAERLKTMLGDQAALKSDDPEIGRLTKLAAQAIGEGALTTAIKLFDQAKARVGTLNASVDQAEADIAARRAGFAAVYARSAEAHALNFDYLAAARDYREAFAQIQRWDDKLAVTYRIAEAQALYDHGLYKADNAALAQSMEVAEDGAKIADRAKMRLDWGTASNVLANAAQALGERERGPEHLDQAVGVYRQILSETGIGLPALFRGKVQNNLANTLTTLGTRAGDAAVLRQAVGAFEAAVTIFSDEKEQHLWVAGQINAGKALLALGELDNSVDTLNRAGQAYEAALYYLSKDTDPLTWGAAQNNMGNVLQALGLRMTDTNIAAARHLQAVAAFQRALQAISREKVPLQWASVQNNLANALQSLGFRQKDGAQALANYRLAIAAQESALEEMTRERAPLMWGTLKGNIGRSYQLLGDGTAEPADANAYYAQAVDAYREALQELTRERVPIQWAGFQSGLALTLQALAQNDSAKAAGMLAEAETAQRGALEVYPAASRPFERAAVQHDLAQTLMMLGPIEGGTARYEAAERIYREEWGARSREADPLGWAKAQAGVGNALRAIGLAKRDRAMLAEARRLTQDAWDTVRPIDGQYDTVMAARLAEIDKALAAAD